MSVKVKTRPKYKNPNNHIWPGLVDDLIETLEHLDMATAVFCMTKMKMQSLQCWCSVSGEEMNIEDLACMYGDNYPAAQAGPVKFYAGPEKNYDTGLVGCEDHRFELIESSVLYFVLDAIMFRLAQNGVETFRELEIPL